MVEQRDVANVWVNAGFIVEQEKNVVKKLTDERQNGREGKSF